MSKMILKATAIFVAILIFTSCSRVDIHDETAVMHDIQGTWIGKARIGEIYRHVKVTISENRFEGWLQTTDSVAEPEWTILPTESGTFSISSVREEESGKDIFRSLKFSIAGRCCGDNSLTAITFSEMITYMNRNGLSLNGRSMKQVHQPE
mgnify:CR=1 FL=1